MEKIPMEEPGEADSLDLQVRQPTEKSQLPPATRAECAIILTCGLLIQVIIFGVNMSMGIYVVEFREYFDCSLQEASTIVALNFGFTMMMGPVSAYMYKRVGCRTTVIFGALTATAGFLLAYFAYNLAILYAAIGAVGIGSGIAALPPMSVQAEYFTGFQLFATAILAAGAAAGGMAFPPLFPFLIDTFTTHGSMLINAGIMLQVVPIGALVKSRIRWKGGKSHNFSIPDHQHDRNRGASGLPFICDPLVLLFLGAGLAWGGCTFAFYNLIVELMTEEEISFADSSLVLMISAIISLVFRVVSSFLAQAKWMNLALFYACSVTIMVGGFFAIIPCSSWLSFVFVACLVTGGLGLATPLLAPLALQVFGLGQFSTVFGYTTFAIGAGGLIGNFLAATASDLLADTVASFYAISAMGVLNSIFCFAIFFLTYRRKPSLAA